MLERFIGRHRCSNGLRVPREESATVLEAATLLTEKRKRVEMKRKEIIRDPPGTEGSSGASSVEDVAIAKLIATLLLAPRGAALVYYGQELGIENDDPKRIEDVQDAYVGLSRQVARFSRVTQDTKLLTHYKSGAPLRVGCERWLRADGKEYPHG